MADERFICHILTIAAVAILLGYMAWKGGEV